MQNKTLQCIINPVWKKLNFECLRVNVCLYSMECLKGSVWSCPVTIICQKSDNHDDKQLFLKRQTKAWTDEHTDEQKTARSPQIYFCEVNMGTYKHM